MSLQCLLVAAFVVASLSSGVPKCVIEDTSAGQHSGSCNGIKYEYRVPKQCLAGNGSCGLILDVHGWTMNGDIQDENTGTRALGEKHGFVVVQPTANRNGELLTSWSPKDDPNVWAILEAARDEPAFGIDRKRLHFMGFSQGSMMTWAMVASHASELASVVAMSCAANDPHAVAAAAGGVPILYSSGYKDGLCPFSENNKTIDTLKGAWSLDKGTVVAKDEHYVRTHYKGAQGQWFETLFWDYDSGNGGICGAIYKGIGAGHCFPGGSDTKCFFDGSPRTSFPQKLTPFSCPAPDTSKAAFKIGEVAVQFFLDHPKATSAKDVVV